jgi:sugar-specific transcriptional regulator TrmB
MPVSDRVARALQELGLSINEVKAYVNILEKGPSTAAEVSTGANIPYSKVYEVLSNLERKGWLEQDDGRPAKYYPKAPQVALEALRLKREAEVREKEALVLGELSALYEQREVRERPEIWIVRGDANIASKVKEVVQMSNREVLFAVPVVTRELVSFFAPALAEANRRGVTIKVLAGGGTDPELLRQLSKYGVVRTRDALFGGGVIADGAQVVLLLGEARGRGERIAIWAEHPGLAKIGGEYFHYLWQGSEHIKAG